MRLSTIAITASLLAGSAGLTLSANAAQDRANNQNRDRTTQRDTHRDASHARTDKNNYPTHFVSADKLHGTTVVNRSGESIGTISDLVIDLGSGYAPYAVVDTSNMIGLGGRTVAVPYASFSWNSAEGQPMLDQTKEQLERLRPFDRDVWASGKSSDFLTDLQREYRQEMRDPYADGLDKSRTATIKGKIISIDREDKLLRDDHTVVVVQTDQGVRRVVLGPSWYVTTRDQPLARDKDVTLMAYEVSRAGEPTYVASWFNVDGQKINLRDGSGRPAWGVRSTGDAGADAARVRDGYALLSELDGKDVSCRGVDCGDVTDMVVECSSGKLAFFVIDPDENFLGIADTNRLAPFEAMSFSTPDTIRLDASKEMVLNSPELPDDLKTLDRAACDRLYRSYDVGRLHREHGSMTRTR